MLSESEPLSLRFSEVELLSPPLSKDLGSPSFFKSDSVPGVSTRTFSEELVTARGYRGRKSKEFIDSGVPGAVLAMSSPESLFPSDDKRDEMCTDGSSC